jgi:hypothetical protein
MSEIFRVIVDHLGQIYYPTNSSFLQRNVTLQEKIVA